MTHVILPIEVAVGSAGVRDARAIVDITTELPMLIECVGRNLRVGVHAEEEAQIEHPLTLLSCQVSLKIRKRRIVRWHLNHNAFSDCWVQHRKALLLRT